MVKNSALNENLQEKKVGAKKKSGCGCAKKRRKFKRNKALS
ncbi:hypothetical protein [Radiobacillus sp. PE A8.2]